MKVRLIVIAFLLATVLMLLLGLATFYAWSMADFDCSDGYWECRKAMIFPVALHLGLPIVVWSLLAWLLVREWKKA